ncbi:unnamed protein product [Boreogadus saida]
MIAYRDHGAEIAEEMEKERRLFQLQMCDGMTGVFHKARGHRRDEEKKQLTALGTSARTSLQLEQKRADRLGYSNDTSVRGTREFGDKKGLAEREVLRQEWDPTMLPRNNNRKYHFQAEDEQEFKEEALTWRSRGGGAQSTAGDSSMEERPGASSRSAQDAGTDSAVTVVAADAGYSTNLGVYLHEDSGSADFIWRWRHVSRIQSMELEDKLGTYELSLVRRFSVSLSGLTGRVLRNVGTVVLMRSGRSLPSASASQPVQRHFTPDCTCTELTVERWSVRREYINANTSTTSSPGGTAAMATGRVAEVYDAVRSRDLLSLIKLYAEGAELLEPLPDAEKMYHLIFENLERTVLHYCVRTSDHTSLHLVDFLVQNSGNLDRQTESGNTALHYAVVRETPGVKLLLRGKLPLTSVG